MLVKGATNHSVTGPVYEVKGFPCISARSHLRLSFPILFRASNSPSYDSLISEIEFCLRLRLHSDRWYQNVRCMMLLAEQPKVNTTSSGLNTFTYQAAKIWNSLPSHYKEASSLSDFKQHILKWPGPDCQCGCWALCRSYDVWSLCTWIFYLFYKCFYRLLVNCHGLFSYIQCVF